MSGFKHFHPLVGALFGNQREIFDPPLIVVEAFRRVPVMAVEGDIAVNQVARHSLVFVIPDKLGAHSLSRHALVMTNMDHIGAIKSTRHAVLRTAEGSIGIGEFCHHLILTSAIPMSDAYLSEGTGTYDVQVDIPEVRLTPVDDIQYRIGNNIGAAWVSTGLTDFPASFEVPDGLGKDLYFRILVDGEPSDVSFPVRKNGLVAKAGYYTAGGIAHETALITADTTKSHLVVVTNYDTSPTADTPVVTYGAAGRAAGTGTVLTPAYNFLGTSILRTCVYMVPTGVGTDFTIRADLTNSSSRLMIGVYEAVTGLNTIGAVNGVYVNNNLPVNVPITPTVAESLLVQLAFNLNGGSNFQVDTPSDMGVVEATYTDTITGRFVYAKKNEDVLLKTLTHAGTSMSSHRDVIAIELKE